MTGVAYLGIVGRWRRPEEPSLTDDPFADIRPYRDDEVGPVLARLLSNRDFLDAVVRLRLPRGYAVFPAFWRTLTRAYLGYKLRSVHDVDSMQRVIRPYMAHMIDATTSGLSVSGLEHLDAGTAYLYISNHRDIAMDPAFVNYALHTNGRDTVRIAIGDNLLTTPWVSDTMRLNKSFVVRRSLRGPRQLLAASRQLSAYIRHSLLQENVPVWIAQREGRAKDGVDRTESGVIKMLAMDRDKSREGFGDYIAGLRPVPVSISYELDPCDALKARELYEVGTRGHYEKRPGEDIASIGRGIAGRKGRVHVNFGRPLGPECDSVAAVTEALDRQIICGYRLHPTNLYAYEMLYAGPVPQELGAGSRAGACSREEFTRRIEAMPAAHREVALGIYANAVRSRLELHC